MILETKTMENMLEKLEIINQADTRQQGKIKYKLNQILATTFIAMSAGANNLSKSPYSPKPTNPNYKNTSQTYTTHPHMTPSKNLHHARPNIHTNLQNTIQPNAKPKPRRKNQKTLPHRQQTQKGNTNNNQKPNHIVSAIDEKSFTIGEKIVNDKSNEITAIPQLLNALNLKDSIVTLDAMGTQKDIAAKIRQKRQIMFWP
jgi:transposase